MECAASAGQETSEAMAFAVEDVQRACRECAHKKAILTFDKTILATGFGKSLWNAILPCVFVHILSKYPVLVAAFPTRCISRVREQRGALSSIIIVKL